MTLRRHNHQRRLSAVLEPVLGDLRPAERRAMEYAALLPPDQVPLPWLQTLVAADFPELIRPGRLSDPWDDPWDDLCGRLVRLALFSRSDSLEADSRIVRVHRLVQDLLCSRMPAEELAARQQKVEELVEARDAALNATTRWEAARWELEPLDALATLWADTNHAGATLLLNQVATRWHHVAEWTRAEPLYRRALAIDEQSYGPEHPDVARDLNNLAQLLRATNRLAEAEPLMARMVEIFLEFTRATGHPHPHLQTAIRNYSILLSQMGRSEAEIQARLQSLAEQYGVSLGN